MTKPIASAGTHDPGRRRAKAATQRIRASKYVPEFGAVKVWTAAGPVGPDRPMTVCDLLRHTSGLYLRVSSAPPTWTRSTSRRARWEQGDEPFRLHDAPRGAALCWPSRAPCSTMATAPMWSVRRDPRWRSARCRSTASSPPGSSTGSTRCPTPSSRRRWESDRASPAITPVRPIAGRLADSPADSHLHPAGEGVVWGPWPRVVDARLPALHADAAETAGELDGVRVLQRKTVAETPRNQLPGEAVPISSPATPPISAWWDSASDSRSSSTSRIAQWVGRASAGGGDAKTPSSSSTRPEQLSAVVMTQFFPFGAHDLDGTFRRLVLPRSLKTTNQNCPSPIFRRKKGCPVGIPFFNGQWQWAIFRSPFFS